MSINNISPNTGRYLKENDTPVNLADMIEALYDALVVNKNAGIVLSGCNVEQTNGATAATKSALVAGITAAGKALPLLVDIDGKVITSVDAVATIAEIEGKAAHDTAASGKPVQVGGVYRATDPAVTDGDAASIRVNAKGEVIAQLSASKPLNGELRFVNNNTNTTITQGGGTEVIENTIGASKISQIKGFYVLIPASNASATGTHNLVISAYNIANALSIPLLKLEAAGNANIAWTNSAPGTGTTATPSDLSALLQAVFSEVFDSGMEIKCTYTNSTNYDHTSYRGIRFNLLEKGNA